MPNLHPDTPAFNEDCSGCLDRALQIQRVVEAMESFVIASRDKDKKLDELIIEVRIANEIKTSQDRILNIMFGDGTEVFPGMYRDVTQIKRDLYMGAGTVDDPGIIALTHQNTQRLRTIWGVLVGGRWAWGCGGGLILATFAAMLLHLYQSGGLSIVKTITGGGP